jgi:serine/threonine protein kinase
MAGAPGVLSRFVREAQATAAIKHDHIVTIYHVGRDNEILFLAMEYLQGLSLERWLERGRKPSIDLALRIGREIAAGLAAAHRRGLIHRDIKPANIWLEAPSGRVKILDFGMARSQRDDVLITQSGTVLGTPAYMAPEQARAESVGAGSDLFSLGCLLYRLCAGQLPFRGPTIMAVLTALSADVPRPPRELNADVPPALDALVMQLLAKDPTARPVSAQAVVDAIKAIERELQVERQRAELAEVSPRPGRPPLLVGRRTRWIVTGVLGTAVATALGGYALVLLLTSRHRLGANQPVAALVDSGGRPIMTPSPENPRQTSPQTSPDHLGREWSHGTVLARGTRALPEAPWEAATIGTDQPPPTRPGQSDPPEQGPAPAQEQSLARVPPREPTAGDGPPSRTTAGEKASPEERAQAHREKKAWDNPIDPDGDCGMELDQGEGKVRIVVPGTPHVLSAEIGAMNAPRLLRDVQGDFEARVTVSGVFHPAGKATVKEYAPYHGAGILLWQDKDNYVRLEIAADVPHGKPRPYVNFEYRKDGSLAVSRGLKIDDGSTHLLLKRQGNKIHAAFGPDGVRWTSLPPMSVKLSDHLKVGIAAINSATKPLTAELEAFEVLEREQANGNVSSSETDR